MINYLLAFLSAVFFNAIPFFAPGTGFVVTFFYVKYELSLFLLIPLMVLGSTLGRFILAKFTGKLASRFLRPERNENLSYFRNQVNKKPIHAFIFTFIYCALPTPSNLIFLSLGASKVNLGPILLGFGLGRAINYTYAALSFSYIYHRIAEELQGSVTSASNIFTQIVTIIVFTIFLLIDWKELLLNKRVRLLVKIGNDKEEVVDIKVKEIMKYHKDQEENISDFSESNIESMYDKGFKFTRLSKGNMQSTKNLRVNLSNFYIFTKNKRIISKYPNLEVRFENLPLTTYDYKLGKLAKDFYDTKFGKGVFSVVKIKEILTSNNSNFNSLAVFSLDGKDVGYCILYKSSNIIHYCYPFYDLSFEASYLGLAMMTKVITEAKDKGFKYVYLGGANASKDMYKLQFKGLEWWDKDKWNVNLEELKEIIKNVEGVK